MHIQTENPNYIRDTKSKALLASSLAEKQKFMAEQKKVEKIQPVSYTHLKNSTLGK